MAQTQAAKEGCLEHEGTGCAAAWKVSWKAGMELRRKSQRELSPHTTAAMSLHCSTLALGATSQQHVDVTSEQTHGSACTYTALAKSTWCLVQLSRLQNGHRSPEAQPHHHEKELRLGNAANKAVQDVRSVGSCTAPGEGLSAGGGNGALLWAVCQPGREK